MKSTVETLSPTRVRLDIEVPFDELKPNIEKAYKTIARQVSIPGFRKGKVPPRLIDQRVGRAAVLEEGINDAIPTYLTRAFEEHTLRVLGRPDVSLNELADGEKIIFSADVDVRPELELPDFSTLEAVVDAIEVSDADVDAEIEKLRERFSTLKTVERPNADNDYIGLDLRARVDGEEVDGGSADNISYRVGSGDLLEGLDEAVRGKSAGDEVTFTAKLVGGERVGEEAEITAVVRSVKEKELPALDEDFVQANSEFDTLEELRAGLREQLAETRKQQRVTQTRDRALKALVAAIEVPLPEQVVDDEITNRKQQLSAYLEQMGLNLDTYLAHQKQTEEEFDASLRDEAQETVRAQLVLDTVADKEELGVDDNELTQEVVRRAQQVRIEPQTYADRLLQSGQLASVVADIRRAKALTLVVEQTKVVDSDGNKVERSEVDVEPAPQA